MNDCPSIVRLFEKGDNKLITNIMFIISIKDDAFSPLWQMSHG